ncbi:MAG: ribosome silencing factor [Steroidobacteraceae bacterium]
MTATKFSRPPARAALVKNVVAALEDMKAVNVKVMDVRRVTDVADCMVLASGNSDRHVRSIADRVVERAKAAGFRPMGMEGERDGEWVLVDLNDVIVHVMLPRVREFYGLEELWEVSPIRAPAKPKSALSRKSAAGASPRSRGKPKAKAKAKVKAKAKGKSTTARPRKPAAANAPRGKKSSTKGSRSRG